MTDHTRRHSSDIVDGPTKAPGRSMLRAVGFTDEDFRSDSEGFKSEKTEK